MSFKVYFDDITHEPQNPTFVLSNRNGDKTSIIPSSNLVIADSLKTHSEISFNVYKKLDDNIYDDWDKLKDFQLMWCREWNQFFELNVELNETNELVKNVVATSLCEAELSQTNLYGVEINTETDISRDDYKDPTIFYDSSNPKNSLLNRILEKVPHYSIKHIDSSLKNIQRTFSFDNISIYDALQDIEEEINCLFIFSSANNDGKLERTISAYDLESYCYQCGHRDEFIDECPKCGSTDVKNGYGEDTTIFISTDNLTDEITYSTDVKSVKNCFRLEAGDDLMTAVIANCNPNGSSYIWYIPDSIRNDMSDELRLKLSSYDALYEECQNTLSITLPNTIIYDYNNLLNKYPNFRDGEITEIPSEIIGYSKLILSYYDTIDFELYLRSKMMPNIELISTTAQEEVSKITSSNIAGNSSGQIGLLNIDRVTTATVTNAVVSLAKTILSSDYRVRANDGAVYDADAKRWTGSLNIYKYNDVSDSADSSNITVYVTDKYSTYVSQQLTKAMTKEIDDKNNIDIVSLFKSDNFSTELKKYCLNSLNSFRIICQSCLDLLIEQGISNKDYWEKYPESGSSTNGNLYEEFYLNYYNKLKQIDSEIKVRESELNIVVGTVNNSGQVIKDGVQSIVEGKIDEIHDLLDLQKYLGSELWKEFISYRREDTYTNDNYISDGLNNAELIDKANEFNEIAQKEIIKSATLQHSISATLKNLLVIKEFEPIINFFKVGNWLRIRVDDNIYRLRLTNYEIDFDDLETISVTFSDVVKTADGYSDIESILDQAESMSSSYSGVVRQAKQGSKGNKLLENWVDKGLELTNMKIVSSADNQNISWDENGFLCRQYSSITDEYDDRQLKIINRGLYVTDDNWQTAKAGIGNFTFYNPKVGEWQESYGVIADTLVGNLILSEEVGIYNTEGSVTIDKNGVIITTDPTVTDDDKVLFEIRRLNENNTTDGYDKVIYFDDNGNACFRGQINATSIYVGNISDDGNDNTLDEYVRQLMSNRSTVFTQSDIPTHGRNGVAKAGDIWVNTDTGEIYYSDGYGWIATTTDFSTISDKLSDLDSKISESDLNNSTTYEALQEYQKLFESFQNNIGQYVRASETEGLVIGKSGSDFRTFINNNSISFCQGTDKVAYITNQMLKIKHAVIENSLLLGNFYFSPHDNDDGFSIEWKE